MPNSSGPLFIGSAVLLLSCSSPHASATNATTTPATVSAPVTPATLSADATEKKVKEIIHNQLEVSEEQLRPEASFIHDLEADSLAVVELVLAFEQEFKITIPEEDAVQIKTVKDAVNYIKIHAK